MSAQVVCCPALTILSVDHLTIHIPARPISTMTEPKAMFVMTSGERTIMSSGVFAIDILQKGLKLYRVTD
jgi:hypothetical protein